VSANSDRRRASRTNGSPGTSGTGVGMGAESGWLMRVSTVREGGCGVARGPRGSWRRFPLGGRRLPTLDPVAVRIRDPAEPAELRAFDPIVHHAALRPEDGDHRIQVVDAVVDHERSLAGTEVFGTVGEDAPHEARLAPRTAGPLALEVD